MLLDLQVLKRHPHAHALTKDTYVAMSKGQG